MKPWGFPYTIWLEYYSFLCKIKKCKCPLLFIHLIFLFEYRSIWTSRYFPFPNMLKRKHVYVFAFYVSGKSIKVSTSSMFVFLLLLMFLLLLLMTIFFPPQAEFGGKSQSLRWGQSEEIFNKSFQRLIGTTRWK